MEKGLILPEHVIKNKILIFFVTVRAKAANAKKNKKNDSSPKTKDPNSITISTPSNFMPGVISYPR